MNNTCFGNANVSRNAGTMKLKSSLKLVSFFFSIIILASCGNASVSSINGTKDSSIIASNNLKPAMADTTPIISTGLVSNSSNKRIRAIEDIYFGIPSSENSNYFNRQITFDKCIFKVKALNYNEHSLGENTISGLYLFSLNSENICSDVEIEYIVKLFSSTGMVPLI